MLIDKDESKFKKRLSQPLQIIIKQFQLAITFLTGCIGIFNVTDKRIKIFIISISESSENNVITIAPGAYELEILDREYKRIIINEGNTRLTVFNQTKNLNFE